MVTGIPRTQIFGHSERLRPFLEKFTENGRYTVEDLLEALQIGERQAWVIGDWRAVALTQLSSERFRTCWITHLSGEGLREWADAFEEIEKWARHLDCAKIEATARPGYERVGKRYGLKKTHVLLEKWLNG